MERSATQSFLKTSGILLVPVLLGGALYFFMRQRKTRRAFRIIRGGGDAPIVRNDEKSEKLQKQFGPDESKRDVVEEASWESFPASDPPAW